MSLMTRLNISIPSKFVIQREEIQSSALCASRGIKTEKNSTRFPHFLYILYTTCEKYGSLRTCINYALRRGRIWAFRHFVSFLPCLCVLSMGHNSSNQGHNSSNQGHDSSNQGPPLLTSHLKIASIHRCHHYGKVKKCLLSASLKLPLSMKR